MSGITFDEDEYFEEETKPKNKDNEESEDDLSAFDNPFFEQIG